MAHAHCHGSQCDGKDRQKKNIKSESHSETSPGTGVRTQSTEKAAGGTAAAVPTEDLPIRGTGKLTIADVQDGVKCALGRLRNEVGDAFVIAQAKVAENGEYFLLASCWHGKDGED